MSEPFEPKRRRTEFDDALKGYYQDHDEVRPEDNPDYRSLTAESVGSLILGVLSTLTFISLIFIIFPLLGVILGVLAIRKILQASEELSGLGISTAGVVLSLIFAVAGILYQIYVYSFEVPPGYEEINFTRLAADPKTGRIPEEIIALTPRRDLQGNLIFAGVPVFIEGYMYPTRQMTEIDRFMLVPAIEQGQFGAATRNPTEMIEVTLSGDLKVQYRTSSVRVGGILSVNENDTAGETPYRLEADVFR
ncbi:MAG: hypothetical protein LBI18_10365 [Planctomycetaceae bacterium]|jgi:hypothetical protein|nr:hypothetical protein [Planctomycetaceae bacterium]